MSWPIPADVRLGVAYGPTGVEYVGEMAPVFSSTIYATVATPKHTYTQRAERSVDQTRVTAQPQAKKQSKYAYAFTATPEGYVTSKPDVISILMVKR